MTGIVRYEKIVCLTVDMGTARKTKVHGSLRGVKKVVKPFQKRDYIKLIEEEIRMLAGSQRPKLEAQDPF